MKQETFKSSTLGEIPLSFTGRRLLANLREAFNTYVEKTIATNFPAYKNVVSLKEHWEPVSKARGELAQYISRLEIKSERPRAYPVDEEFRKFGEELVNGKAPPPKDSVSIPAPQPTEYHMHLPPIPEGYELQIVGNIVTMEPKQQNQVDESNISIVEKQKQKRERLASLLNEYRQALQAVYSAPFGYNTQTQERVDKARLAIFEFLDCP